MAALAALVYVCSLVAFSPHHCHADYRQARGPTRVQRFLKIEKEYSTKVRREARRECGVSHKTCHCKSEGQRACGASSQGKGSTIVRQRRVSILPKLATKAPYLPLDGGDPFTVVSTASLAHGELQPSVGDDFERITSVQRAKHPPLLQPTIPART